MWITICPFLLYRVGLVPVFGRPQPGVLNDSSTVGLIPLFVLCLGANPATTTESIHPALVLVKLRWWLFSPAAAAPVKIFSLVVLRHA